MLAERRNAAPPDDLPLALVAEGPHGPVVHDLNRAARLAGVRMGARITDMRALCPGLLAEPADPAGDGAALRRLAFRARRWCPWTAADGAAGLVLDSTGSDHLWGGEAALLAEIEGRLAVAGFTARLAVAPTWGAAWALARHGGLRAVCTVPDLAPTLAPLPNTALRLDGPTVLALNRLGLKTVGDVADLPRDALARRFSNSNPWANPLLRLDQALGRLAEPLAPPADPPEFRTEARLAEPALDPAPHLPGLAGALCDRLAAAGAGCRQLRLELFRSDGEVSALSVSTAAPSRDPAHLAALFGERLGRLDPGFGFDLIALQARAVEALTPAQVRLDGRPDAEAGLARLADRLAARFGPGALVRPVPRASHLPERAEARLPALAGAKGEAETPPQDRPDRPIRLFDHPEEVRVLYAVPEGPPVQFVWRRRTHRTARYQGPERIAPEWWQDKPGTRLRDYYRIEDQAGLRLWLYREGVLGDGRGATPRWFVHGVFA